MRPTLDDPGDRDVAPPEAPILDGRYVLEGVVATGGMGIVYRAHHAAIGTRFAVKVLKASSASDPDAVARFRREARTAGALEHPNIVRVHDFGMLPDGRSYFVMELLDGVDLATEIARARIEPARAAKIALEILDALVTAHASDIVHRDLKPENVMLVRDSKGLERLKVLDFGIAKIVGDKLASAVQPALASGATFLPSVSLPGVTLGTPVYMSPEHCRGERLDARADIYALGVMLYEMVTGAVPFEHEDLWELVRLHLEAAPRRPSELVPDLPPALEAVILRCLAKAPGDRFASAEEMAGALRAFLEPPPVVEGVEMPLADTLRTRRPSRAPRYAIAAVVVASILGSVGIGLATTGEHRSARAAPLKMPSVIARVPVSELPDAPVAIAPAPIEPAPLPAAPRAPESVRAPARVQERTEAPLLPPIEAAGAAEAVAVSEPAASEPVVAAEPEPELSIERPHPLLDPWEE